MRVNLTESKPGIKPNDSRRAKPAHGCVILTLAKKRRGLGKTDYV